MNSRTLREKATELRKKGNSYGAIQKTLGVSKSTLSYWLKEIRLSPDQRKALYTQRIMNLARGPNSVRERRRRQIEKVMEAGKEEIMGPIPFVAYKLFGVALYWAEGTKKGLFEFTNSEPTLVYFMVKWLHDVCKVNPLSLRARLNVYAKQDEQEIRKFWSDICGIPQKNFSKSYVKPTSRGFKRNNLYYGTIKITVPKSTDLKLRVFSWLEAAFGRRLAKSNLILRRWERIQDKDGIEKSVNLT